MIVTEDKLIFLDNRKCGSSTMRRYYGQIAKKIVFQSTKNITQCAGDFSDPNYVHVNLKGALKYIKAHNENVEDFKIFTTIRNPYERFLSYYRYYTRRNEGQVPDDELKINSFLARQATKSCFPEKFRFCGDYEVKNLIKVENLHNDLERFNKIHKIGFKIDPTLRINASSNILKNFIFTNELVEYIDSNYSADFLSGDYRNESCEELNDRLGWCFGH